MTIVQKISLPKESFKQLNDRDIGYRFDLEKDIPWQAEMKGRYFTDELLHLFGFNSDALSDPATQSKVEWCWALAICNIFVFFEKDIIGLIRDSKNKISQTKSSALLIEEEVKHIRLFKGMAKKLEQDHPEWVTDFYQCYADPQAYNIPFAQRSDLDRIEQHQFLIWLYTLFFENFTVYLHEKLIPGSDSIQETWFKAQECHRNEEEEHVRTDQAYLEECGLSVDEMKSLGKEFFLLLSFNYEGFFGLDTCERFMKATQPENESSFGNKSLFITNEFTELPFFKEIITHPVFSSSMQWTEVLFDYFSEAFEGQVSEPVSLDQVSSFSQPRTLIEALEKTASIYPEKTLSFWNFESELVSTSYGDLVATSKHKAACLLAAEANAQASSSRYALLYFPDIENTLVWFWAAIYAGKTPVVLAFSGTLGQNNEESNRFRKILKTLPETIILTNDEFAVGVEQLQEASGIDLFTAEMLSNIPEDQLSSVSIEVNVDPEKEAIIQFSSGSTGDPKGISLTHSNILTNAFQMIDACGGVPEDKFLNWMPLHHDMGLIGYHLTPIVNGSSQYQLHPIQFLKSPGVWASMVSEHSITKSGITNSALRNLVRWSKSKKSKGVSLSSLNSVIVGAEPIQVSTIEDVKAHMEPLGFKASCLTPAYGMAEASLAITFKGNGEVCRAERFDRSSLVKGEHVIPSQGSTSIELVSLGKAVPGLDIEVIDSDEQVLEQGVLGYLRFRGENVSKGFWRNERFQSTLSEDGWFVSKDLGFIQDQELFLLGRADEVFFKDGKNYFLNDIDNVVEQLPFVKPGGVAAVVDPFSQQGPDDVLVFVDPKSKDPSDIGKQLKLVRDEISQRMGVEVGRCVSLPRRVFNKTTSGKIKRFEMYADFEKGRFGELTAYPETLNDPCSEDASLELMIAGIWSRVLETEIHESQWQISFQDLGGTSLKALKIHNELEEVFNKPLNPSWLITKNTIHQMAEALRQKGLASPKTTLEAKEERTETSKASEADNLERTVLTSSPNHKSKVDQIAIVGIGLRYPGANNLKDLHHALQLGKHDFSPMSDARWKLIGGDSQRLINGQRPFGSFLEDIDSFDAEAFGFSEALIRAMDPQTRFFIEMATDALCETRLSSQKVGVFAAGGDNEYADRVISQADYSSNTLGGSLQNMLAAQISRLFNFQGPALKVNTACSSSLYALHMAVQSLKTGESDLALAGGIQINLTENGFKAFNAAGLLRQDGPAKPFGDGASGLVPGEGGAIVALKRLDDALADDDDVIAIVRATAVNNDGPSLSGTSPNPNGQINLLSDLYHRENLTIGDLDYFEAHAAGTAIGDGIEVGAIQRVRELLKEDMKRMVPVGSSKAYFGHTLSASGITSLAKVLASIRYGEIPATIINGKLTERIEFQEAGLTPLESSVANGQINAQVKRVGINSLGLGGTNVHAIIEDFSRESLASDYATNALHDNAPALPTMVSIGGSTKRHLSAQVEALTGTLQGTTQSLLRPSLLRDQHATYRSLVWDVGNERLSNKILETDVSQLLPLPRHKPKVAFVYPGPGSQFKGMGRMFFDSVPAFAMAIQQCHELLMAKDFDLIGYLYGDLDPNEMLRIDISQPIVFSFSYALTCMLRALGVEPQVVLGHSAGEYAAAVTSGMLSLNDGISCILKRGQLMARSAPGAMAAVNAPRQKIEPYLSRYQKLWIASANCDTQFTVSGEATQLDQFIADCELAKLDVTKLDIGCAAHTEFMKDAALELKHFLQDIDFNGGDVPFVSTSDEATYSKLDATYFAEQLVKPVCFEDAIHRAIQAGIDTFVEVSSTSGLSYCMKRILPEESHVKAVSMMIRGQSDFEHTLCSLNQLYQQGINLRLDRWLPESTDTYSEKLVPWYAKTSHWIYPRRQQLSNQTGNIVELNGLDYQYAGDHRVAGKASTPFGVLMDMLAFNLGLDDAKCLKNVVLMNALTIDEHRGIEIHKQNDQVSVSALGNHSAHNDQLLFAEFCAATPRVFTHLDIDLIHQRCREAVDPSNVYLARERNGMHIGQSLRAIKSGTKNDTEALLYLQDPGNQNGRCLQASLIDAAMQGTSVFFDNAETNSTYFGFGMDSWTLIKPLSVDCCVYITLKENINQGEMFKFDLLFCDEKGALISEILGFTAKRFGQTETPIALNASPPNTQQHSLESDSVAHSEADHGIQRRLYDLLSGFLEDQITPAIAEEAFSNLGINSIKAVKIAKKIEEEFHLKLPATLLFETPNILALQRALERRLK